MPKRFQAPRPPRLKGFPQLPRLPYELQPAGETSEQVLEQDFNELRQLYPALVRPEFLVFKWLMQYFGEGSQGMDWDYQVPLIGGREIAGGAVADFVVYDNGFGRGQVWRTQDEHFHYLNPSDQASDILEKTWLEGEGWEVVDLLGAHLEQDVDRVCRAALAGQTLYDDPIAGGQLPPRTVEV